MPHITYVGPVLGNRDYGYVVGSGFSRAGFRLDTYHFLDSRDDPTSASRRPSGVVADFITNGVTETNHNASLRQTPGTYVVSDDFAFYDAVHTTKTASTNFLIFPFNTSEGSGNGLWVNKPRIDFIETLSSYNYLGKGLTYRIKGEALTKYHSIVTTDAGSDKYDTKVYLCSGVGYETHECFYYKLEGNDNQGNVNGESYVSASFTVPTGIPDGTYNLYLYGRFNKANIASYSGIRILTSLPTPSSLTIDGTNWGLTGSTTTNASSKIQDFLFVAASSIRNYTHRVEVTAQLPEGDYLLRNPIYVPSGVTLQGPARLYIDELFDQSTATANIVYTRPIPAPYVANDFIFVPGITNGGYRASVIVMIECSKLKKIELEFGTPQFGSEAGVYLTKKWNTDGDLNGQYPTVTYGGHQNIEDCNIHTHFPHKGVAIQSFGSLENVTIYNNDIKGFDGILGYSVARGTYGWRKGWRVLNNNFEASCGRNTRTALGIPIGINCIFAYNNVRNIQRGIIFTDSYGPCYSNLILRNNFDAMGDMFNGSEIILWEGRGGMYVGSATNVISTGIKINAATFATGMPHQYLSVPWVTGNIIQYQYKRINVREGYGKGQTRHIVGMTSDGWLQIDRPWDVTPDTNSVFQVTPMFDRNAIVANHFRDSLGGIELYTNSIENFIANNNFLDSYRGINLSSAYEDGSNGVTWYNSLMENVFDNSQIIIRTPRATGTSPDVVMGFKVNESFMCDTPIILLDLQYNHGTGDSEGDTNKSEDFYGTAAASGSPPSFKGLFFGGMCFETISWHSRANKVLNFSPFNVSPHGLSGIMSTATQKDAAYDGPNVVEVCGENRTLSSATSVILSNQRRWVDA